jgi:alanine racemase
MSGDLVHVDLSGGGELHRPTRAEIDAAALARNAARLLDAAGRGTELCAVVKADGYGHGAVIASRAAIAGGATWLAVALVEEGAQLRAAGIDVPVLLLSEPPVSAAAAIVAHRLTPTVYRPEMIAALDRLGRERGRPVAVHVKLDTGMTRVGVAAHERDTVLTLLRDADGLDVEGVWTHLARADEPSQPTTGEQLVRFGRGLDALVAHGLAPRLVHVANSAGALVHAADCRSLVRSRLPDARMLVRAGIALYGLDPGGEIRAVDHGLEPVLRLVSAVSHVRRIDAGTPVSYGHRWRAPADGWLATVPIGYADGMPRVLTGRAEVLLGGVRRPVAGTITMDQILVWCAQHVPAVGDEVVLLGEQAGGAGSERLRPDIRMDEWAQAAGTITYEIATGITARVPRVERA